MPEAMAAVVMESGPTVLMVNCRVVACTGVPVSSSWTVKVEDAGVVGIPEMVPAAERERPAGSWPVAIVQVYGGRPPVAARGWEYDVPVVAGLRVDVVMISGSRTVSAR